MVRGQTLAESGWAVADKCSAKEGNTTQTQRKWCNRITPPLLNWQGHMQTRASDDIKFTSFSLAVALVYYHPTYLSFATCVRSLVFPSSFFLFLGLNPITFNNQRELTHLQFFVFIFTFPFVCLILLKSVNYLLL